MLIRSQALLALRVCILLLVPSVLAGCGVPWMVIKESGPPPALQGVDSVVVNFDYTGMMVGGMGGDKPEAQWVAEKSVEENDYPKTWGELKGKWEAMFMEGIADASPVATLRGAPGATPSPNAAVVTVTLNNLQVGKYMVFAATASGVTVTHTWSRAGEVVDQIQTRGKVEPTMTTPSVFQHIDDLGRDSGKLSGKFLSSKQD
jgi:hypothetical protein